MIHVFIYKFAFYKIFFLLKKLIKGEKKRPLPNEFNKYLPWFLNSTVSDSCKLTGLAYKTDVIRNDTSGEVISSRFRLSHSGNFIIIIKIYLFNI